MLKPAVQRLTVFEMRRWCYERLSDSDNISSSKYSPLPPNISPVLPWPTQPPLSTLPRLLDATLQ